MICLYIILQPYMTYFKPLWHDIAICAPNKHSTPFTDKVSSRASFFMLASATSFEVLSHNHRLRTDNAEVGVVY